MEENKMIQVPEGVICKLDTALNAISELAGDLYFDKLGTTTRYIFTDGATPGQNKLEKAFFWINDNYNQISSTVLAIKTLSEFAKEFIPDYY